MSRTRYEIRETDGTTGFYEADVLEVQAVGTFGDRRTNHTLTLFADGAAIYTGSLAFIDLIVGEEL